ncbi:MAG TPA: hypothetical protein VG028_01230 [Terriglobia bacterium]|nr:hypothetical protein [Terriglobia bacterium]
MSKNFDHLTVLLSFSMIFSTCAWAQPQNTDKVTTKNVNNIRFADQFNGDSGTRKQDAAISDIGNGPGLVVAPPGTGPGGATAYKNNIPILDLRQTSDIIVGKLTNADRVSPFLIENHLGDFTTRPLTGTITLTRGVQTVRGVNGASKFLSELVGGTNGSLIKLNSDGTMAWARVDRVLNDYTAHLAAVYTGAGGSGAASAAVTQLTFAIRNTITGGNPPDSQSGETVGATVMLNRTGGRRGMGAANFNVTYSTPAATTYGGAKGEEIDLSNMSGSDDNTSVNTIGLDILSAGTNHPNTGLTILSTSNGRSGANNWQRGAFITGYNAVGVLIQGARDHLQFYTGAAPNSDAQIGGRTQDDRAYLWNINNDGTAAFSGVTLHPNRVETLPPPAPGNAGMMARVSDSTPVNSEGQPCVGGSNHNALAFSDGTRWKCF